MYIYCLLEFECGLVDIYCLYWHSCVASNVTRGYGDDFPLTTGPKEEGGELQDVGGLEPVKCDVSAKVVTPNFFFRAANLRPHGEQNGQELVGAVSVCCSLIMAE
jgi:hypothetical protein